MGRGRTEVSRAAEGAEKMVYLSLHFHLFCLAWADPKVNKRGSTAPWQPLYLTDCEYKNQYGNTGVESRLRCMQQPCVASVKPWGQHHSPVTNLPLMHVKDQCCPPPSGRHPLSEPWGRAPGSRGGAGHSSASQAALTAPRACSSNPGSIYISGLGPLIPTSISTCLLDFFLAFSTDFTVSPAADRAAIRDSMSDIFRGRRKTIQMVAGGFIMGLVCHHWLGKVVLTTEPSPHSLPAAPERLLRPLCPPTLTALSQ